MPAVMSATCEPWPPAQGAGMADVPQSIGSASGCKTTGAGAGGSPGARLGQNSPTKSNPATTFAVGKSPSVVVFLASAVVVPYAAVYAAAVPGPPKSRCV